MNAVDIIKKKISAEGFDIPRDILFDYVMKDIKRHKMEIFQYRSVVFVVSSQPGYPVVHLFSDSSGHYMWAASRQFMVDVWKRFDHKFLIAPILSSKVKSLASRMGWKSTGEFTATGHEIFIVERS